jgi:hypothetical protein
MKNVDARISMSFSFLWGICIVWSIPCSIELVMGGGDGYGCLQANEKRYLLFKTNITPTKNQLSFLFDTKFSILLLRSASQYHREKVI